MKYLPIIIILFLILFIFIALYIGYRHLRRKTREVSRALFGTDSLIDGIEKSNMENASTPKSIAAMTRLMLPRITADFPDFQYDEMKERSERVLVSYLRGIAERNLSLLTDGNSELKQQLENQIQMTASRNQKEHFEQIRIHQTEITQYRKAKGRCIITFQSSLEYYHYITDSAGQIQQGSKDYKKQTRYNVNLIYIQDRDLVENELESALAVNCPNCGAPLSSLGAKVCEYCDSPIIEINIHAWSFSSIEEA